MGFTSNYHSWRKFLVGRSERNSILFYIYIASSSLFLGLGFVILVLYICARYDINIVQHLWLVVLPAAAAILINVLLVELFRKLTGRKQR